MIRYATAKVYIDQDTTRTMNIYYYQSPFDTLDSYYFIIFEDERLEVVYHEVHGWVVSVLRG